MLVPLTIVVLLISLTTCAVDACTPVQVQEAFAPHCFKYIDGPIPAALNQMVLDDKAHELASTSPAFSGLCTFYISLEYQCNKYFPRCVNGTRTSLCREVCYRGEQQYDCYDHSDRYFEAECTSTAYGDEPNCLMIDRLPDTGGRGELSPVIIVLASLMGVAGVSLLGSYLYNLYRERTYVYDPSEPDFEEEKNMRRMEEARRNATGSPSPPSATASASASKSATSEQYTTLANPLDDSAVGTGLSDIDRGSGVVTNSNVFHSPSTSTSPRHEEHFHNRRGINGRGGDRGKRRTNNKTSIVQWESAQEARSRMRREQELKRLSVHHYYENKEDTTKNPSVSARVQLNDSNGDDNDGSKNDADIGDDGKDTGSTGCGVIHTGGIQLDVDVDHKKTDTNLNARKKRKPGGCSKDRKRKKTPTLKSKSKSKKSEPKSEGGNQRSRRSKQKSRTSSAHKNPREHRTGSDDSSSTSSYTRSYNSNSVGHTRNKQRRKSKNLTQQTPKSEGKKNEEKQPRKQSDDYAYEDTLVDSVSIHQAKFKHNGLVGTPQSGRKKKKKKKKKKSKNSGAVTSSGRKKENANPSSGLG